MVNEWIQNRGIVIFSLIILGAILVFSGVCNLLIEHGVQIPAFESAPEISSECNISFVVSGAVCLLSAIVFYFYAKNETHKQVNT